MPLVTLEQLGINPHIWLDVDDKVIHGTIRKFKAEVIKLTYAPRDQHVTVKVLLYPYSAILNEDGSTSYGEPLANISGFTAEEDLLIANNSTIVNMASGDIIGEASVLIASPELIAANEAPAVLDEDGITVLVPAGPLHGINYMGEYDFFKFLSVTQDVRVEQMIIDKVVSKHGDGTGSRNLTPTE